MVAWGRTKFYALPSRNAYLYVFLDGEDGAATFLAPKSGVHTLSVGFNIARKLWFRCLRDCGFSCTRGFLTAQDVLKSTLRCSLVGQGWLPPGISRRSRGDWHGWEVCSPRGSPEGSPRRAGGLGDEGGEQHPGRRQWGRCCARSGRRAQP